MLFNDPSHKKWTDWDYKLTKAHFLVQDWYRDGIPVWWDESDRVTFDAKARFSKSRAAIDRAQEADGKKKSKAYGKYYVTEPRVIDGGEMPTRDEWIEEQERKRGMTKVQHRNDGPQILQGKNKR